MQLCRILQLMRRSFFLLMRVCLSIIKIVYLEVMSTCARLRLGYSSSNYFSGRIGPVGAFISGFNSPNPRGKFG